MNRFRALTRNMTCLVYRTLYVVSKDHEEVSLYDDLKQSSAFHHDVIKLTGFSETCQYEIERESGLVREFAEDPWAKFSGGQTNNAGRRKLCKKSLLVTVGG